MGSNLPTTRMESYIEIFAICLSIISGFHSFPFLPCLLEVPCMTLLLICSILWLQKDGKMPKKVHRWVNCFRNTKHYRLVASYRKYSSLNALKTEETPGSWFISRSVTLAGITTDACGLPLTSCHFFSSHVLLLLLSPEEGKESNKWSRVGTPGDFAP